MHVEEEEDEDNERRPNPQTEMDYKVIVTKESGLQAADPTRWGQQGVICRTIREV